jgi:hypothetical protein
MVLGNLFSAWAICVVPLPPVVWLDFGWTNLEIVASETIPTERCVSLLVGFHYRSEVLWA